MPRFRTNHSIDADQKPFSAAIVTLSEARREALALYHIGWELTGEEWQEASLGLHALAGPPHQSIHRGCLEALRYLATQDWVYDSQLPYAARAAKDLAAITGRVRTTAGARFCQENRLDVRALRLSAKIGLVAPAFDQAPMAMTLQVHRWDLPKDEEMYAHRLAGTLDRHACCLAMGLTEAGKRPRFDPRVAKDMEVGDVVVRPTPLRGPLPPLLRRGEWNARAALETYVAAWGRLQRSMEAARTALTGLPYGKLKSHGKSFHIPFPHLVGLTLEATFKPRPKPRPLAAAEECLSAAYTIRDIFPAFARAEAWWTAFASAAGKDFTRMSHPPPVSLKHGDDDSYAMLCAMALRQAGLYAGERREERWAAFARLEAEMKLLFARTMSLTQGDVPPGHWSTL